MNKDVDERIVPKGEYRDALNIEIRTSGDSDVGAVQNLYGTKGRVTYSSDYGDVNPTINWLGRPSAHVGSISNERTNKAYFFIASPLAIARKQPGFSWTAVTSTKLYKDMIVEYDNTTRGITPVAVDVWRIETPIATLGNIGNGSAINEYNHIEMTGSEATDLLRNIRPGMSIELRGVVGNNLISTYKPSMLGGDNGLDVGIIKILKTNTLDNGNIEVYFDRYVTGDLTAAHHCVLESSKTLNFSYYYGSYNLQNNSTGKNIITGINIIPDTDGGDLLFWTDNRTEPKKINIKRSKAGGSSFDEHTNLMINNPSSYRASLQALSQVDPGTHGALKEDHITVIKRAPRTSPRLVMGDGVPAVNNSSTSTLVPWSADSGVEEFAYDWWTINFSQANPGDSFNVAFPGPYVPQIGDRVELSSGSTQQIVVIIKDSIFESDYANVYEIEIDIIDESVDGYDGDSWKVSKHVELDDPYFRLKFGRFGYRYKYQDGEYSSFSPWSEIAFIPGKYDYVPKKGFNLGMVNNIRSLQVTDFIVDDALRPDDVLEVDILYKDTASPNVYIVKTIKRSKNHEWEEIGTGTYSGLLNITSEMIHRTLESSQILRAWDNVPRKALAQEITGNRIVYGNYLQNYNINSPVFVRQHHISSSHPGSIDDGRNVRKGPDPISAGGDKPGYELALAELMVGDFVPHKSLKSIRKYRIGVVFGDKYGRETPVIGLGGLTERFNGKEGALYPDSVNVSKEYCASLNQLVAQLEWKDTKPASWMEYYKFYVKETSNEYYNMVQDRWYNAEDGNVWLSFQSADRNKVDIETYLILKNDHGGESPVLDKARYKILAIKNEAPDFIKTTNKILGCAPLEGDYDMSDSMVVSFEDEIYNAYFSNIEFKGVGYGRLRAIEGGTVRYSEWQKIARMNDTTKTITLVDPFGDSALFTESLGLTNYSEIDEYEFEVKDAVVENRPEFDGKFFIKIYKDAVLSTKVMDITEDGLNYATTDTLKFGYVANTCTNDRPGAANAFRGDYSGISNPTPGSAGDTDYTGKKWSFYQNVGGLSTDCNSGGSCTAMANSGSDSRDATRDFWRWYSDHSRAKGIPFIDHARGAAGGGDSDIVADSHLGLHFANWSGNMITSSKGVNAIQFGVMGADSFSGIWFDFYNKMTDVGRLFRFSADPTKTIYMIAGSKSPWNGHNYHRSGSKLCDGDGVCRRNMFTMYFHKKSEPTVGLLWGDWDPRSAVMHDGSKISTIEFVEAHFDRSEPVNITSGNAIWETEPKEDVGMDLYYEATDAIPMFLKNENIQSYVPIGSKVKVKTASGTYVDTSEHDPITVHSAARDIVGLMANGVFPVSDIGISLNNILEFTHSNGTVTESSVIANWKPLHDSTSADYRPNSWTQNALESGFYRLSNELYHRRIVLPWFNCYSFGNGVESDRIRDDFNAPTIDNGCKVSTTLDSFGEEHRAAGMIWSGIYNSTSGVNNLNEFNMANPITKDLNPSYGSLQALKTRDTNVVAFCEDKVFQILANKDSLYNADGSSNVTASNAVLGDAKAFKGDYGISTNPESLAVDYIRMYFTDKQRNKVIRLSQDGLTPISDVGMISWFRDNLDTTQFLIGSFDEVKGQYNLSLVRSGVGYSNNVTVSWSESTKGWSSFKSFVPETGLSINDEYLTGRIIYDTDNANNINNKPIWSHHNEDLNIDGSLQIEANNFYGQHYNSTVTVMFNQSPEVIKSFASMNYEGTQARVQGWDYEDITDVNNNTATYNNTNYQDLLNDTKDGWYVSSFNTNEQEGQVPEFLEREGKWFEYIKGITTTLANLDTSEFTVQGISNIDIVSAPIATTFTLTIRENDV